MKKIIILVLILVLIAGGYMFFENMDSEINESETVTQNESQSNSNLPKDTSIKMEDGTIGAKTEEMVGEYEDNSLEDALHHAETGKAVLFFKASWCPTCKAVDADILSHLKDIPKDVAILKVDYDNSTELKKKYGVTYQHTFVQIDKNGNLIKKWAGSQTLTKLLSEIK